MSTQQQQQHDGHIIMFPFMAHGHFTRFIALAKFISQRKPNTKITIVSTPLNVKHLQSTLQTSETNSNIGLAEIPFSSADHGLPTNSESLDSLPPKLIPTFFYALETLKPSFDNFITETIRTDKHLPSCIIFDLFLGWVTDTAKRVGTFSFCFLDAGYGAAMYFSICLHFPHRTNDDSNELIEEFYVPEFPDTCRLYLSQLIPMLRYSSKESAFGKFAQRHISLMLKSDGMLCNSVEEIDVVGLKILRNLMESKRVWTVGPLLPSYLLLGHQNKNNGSVVTHFRKEKEFGISPESCIEWLNHQKPSSVLYISFGSQFTISAPKMMELALGLEKSGKNFIWVLKPPSGFDSKSEFKSEWLPEGFVERMNETQKGLLVKKWAPQLEILCHRSTGVFLSHCGWNSVLESLSQGVPIIGWPLFAEQHYNSKMIQEEMRVSVELARGDETELCSEDVKKVIEQVMDSSKGEEMRKKATVIAEKIGTAMREYTDEAGGHQKGSSIRSVDEFFATVTSKRVADAQERAIG
ncbi:UDP-glycosyltransferase 92A1-like [Papaver somniferum]|uniref:UDP-glycosyltransferase 92A1-like n=1 Tax=Papaver somniferum TaxID=3469 RepID=UPI000E6FDCAB|nr:UDP-glycosyltransferase 92A1-like [Papaver somniferum]